MSANTVVILGGGVGGLVAANELRQCLPHEHRIVLVERNPQHTFAPSYPWLMTGSRRPEQISRDIRRLARPGVEVELAEAHGIDLAARRVETSGHSIDYDYLIIALGAELAPEAIPGLSDASHTFYTFEGAQKLHEALQTFRGGRVAVVVSALPYKCPGAPHEGAMLIADFSRRRGMLDRVEVDLYTPEGQPMAVAGPALGDAVRQMLEAKGIGFHPLHKLTGVNKENRKMSFEGREPVGYDLLVAIPPHRPPRLAREAGLANEAGWIPVDRATLATGHENVYAIGDVAAISIPGRWKPDVPLALPKAGVFAHGEAKVVAQRIAVEITGSGSKDVFRGDGYCTLETGEGLAGFAFGDFFAEPSPRVELRRMGRVWHLGRVLFEQWWLTPFGPRRAGLQLALMLGGKAFRTPVVL